MIFGADFLIYNLGNAARSPTAIRGLARDQQRQTNSSTAFVDWAVFSLFPNRIRRLHGAGVGRSGGSPMSRLTRAHSFSSI
jgi:hypothetical protein